MKQHCSQTIKCEGLKESCVWVPYETTLLSNDYVKESEKSGVWAPYETTLLSNLTDIGAKLDKFESPMKQQCSQTIKEKQLWQM